MSNVHRDCPYRYFKAVGKNEVNHLKPQLLRFGEECTAEKASENFGGSLLAGKWSLK